MKIYRDLKQLPHFENLVLSIGSFDGVHPGHRHILKQMQHSAAQIDGETLLISFYPHPRIALAAHSGTNSTLKLLNCLDEKATLLENYGLDHLVIVPFSKEFSEQSPDEYIVEFLIKNFHPKVIVIGYDHKFGKNRSGDIEYLRKFQDNYHYKLLEISKQEIDGIAVSSTKIRKALDDGNVALAEKLLGYPYCINGYVVKGQQIGRKLGFPTANIAIDCHEKLIPNDGIYAVNIKIEEKKYRGMLYIGSRPTLKSFSEKTIEVNIFDFSENIYDKHLTVEFIDFIRNDIKFDSLEDLKI